MLDFLIEELIGQTLAELIPRKLVIYIIALLMAVAAMTFGYLSGHIVYDLIVEPKSIVKVVIMGIGALLISGLSIGSLYLMSSAWRSRND
ncbi:hypothetical protein LOH54_04275 [Sulfurimonas sp. HSL-3221]|uniref:hypothetical protein n=1 Tax=Sulfurimonadaceae TaxID=2771471 RepID=UPI001E426742|nr:hypothetical protein [Sulfurimonas sp. HSL-3221]UFS63350.1 hypothetical protein LOH54_04275 [Sulfurimonas sp. HSL-3221]